MHATSSKGEMRPFAKKIGWKLKERQLEGRLRRRLKLSSKKKIGLRERKRNKMRMIKL